MDSLEIINNEIESYKRSIYSLEKLANKTDKDDMAYGYIKSNCVTFRNRIKQLEQIKLELEILKILLKNAWVEKGTKRYEGIEIIHIDIGNRSSKEDFYLVKKILESNKVGDSND